MLKSEKYFKCIYGWGSFEIKPTLHELKASKWKMLKVNWFYKKQLKLLTIFNKKHFKIL